MSDHVHEDTEKPGKEDELLKAAFDAFQEHWEKTQFLPRQKKLDLCLDGALREMREFLDDPKRIAQFNADAEKIADDYTHSSVHGTKDTYKNLLRIDPKRAEELKDLDFTVRLDAKEESASIVTNTREICFSWKETDQHSYEEVQKIMLHEIFHGILRYQRGYNALKFKEFSHAEELCCDIFTDHVQPWPRWADIVKKDLVEATIGSEFSEDPAFKEAVPLLADIMFATRSEVLDKNGGETHPSDLKRYTYSKDASDNLSVGRANDYLERIYDNYDADYASAKAEQFSINTKDLIVTMASNPVLQLKKKF